MADQPAPPETFNIGELVLGTLDVLVAFGVTLANAGLLTRDGIADMMRIVGEQQARQFGDNPSRRWPAETMRAFMSLPVAEGRGAAKLFVVDGGKPDDPEPAA